MIGWIIINLANRTCQMHLGDVVSEGAAVPSGVPRGSVIGFLLLPVIANELPDGVQLYIACLQMTHIRRAKVHT